MAWTDTRYGHPDYDIRGRYVSSHGNSQGTADFLIEGDTQLQHSPAMPVHSEVATDASLTVWVDERGATLDIWGRAFP